MRTCSRITSTLLVLVCFQVASFYLYAAAPVINPNGIVNNASFAAGTNPIAPGTIAAIFGTNLNDGSQIQFPIVTNGKLATTLGGASVTFNGVAAPLFSSFPTQLNVLVPLELTGATSAQVIVTVAGQSSAPQTVAIAPFSPGIFTINSQGQGAVRISNTAIYAAITGTIQGALAEPASRGDFISIFATGLGAVSNSPATGVVAGSSPLSNTITLPQVTIGGVSAQVIFSGLAPGFAGLYQVDIQVPPGLPTGNAVPVVLTIGGQKSNTITVPVFTGGSGNTIVFQGTAQSVSLIMPGRGNFVFDDSATGSATITATATASGNQTNYSISGNGSGTVSCQSLTGSATTSNWTISITGTGSVSPAVTSLTGNASASGSSSFTFTANACGQSGSFSGTGQLSATAGTGGAVTVVLTINNVS